MLDVAELRKLAKDLQSGGSPKETIDILHLLKKDVVASESLLRESRIGLAVGKLRSNVSKEVADLAKELVKKWKNEVGGSKGSSGPATHHNAVAKPIPVRKASVAESVGSPTTPTGSSFARSSKTDGVVINVTKDKTRDKCIELIYDSLVLDSAAPSDLILKRATAIESTVLEDHNNDTGKEYKGKIRSLFLNLKDKNNPGLRANIVSGELEVAKFCRMSSQEMASEERKAADKAIQEENFYKSLGAEEQQAETDAFQCGKCKQRKTRYRQAQTRSADEPMTTFVTCVNCNHRWKFS
ncbi:transcription elongation factor [Fomitiporia mediterranea MF3/22]|uniref:transcription elongation factor n=1 Tax=Fomitiporia mediterranea (strain MF3/22) TaxID=694068 RepID=UPI0004407676|nr:transcription elongation factor [Fomitiporia mediterranea MF3/22]EJD06163.1 transcription elongation factor [Fomitiporia mediterranea MF3/22]